MESARAFTHRTSGAPMRPFAPGIFAMLFGPLGMALDLPILIRVFFWLWPHLPDLAMVFVLAEVLAWTTFWRDLKAYKA